ncbi:hypothetical protein GCM10010279_58670 [Streptomyces mutabilis]|nr:hypothetical protein GCM10010279_58670 [Streptomyces mutabilis]
MSSEFNGRPERAAESEAASWQSMEELLPVFEREGIALNLKAHPDDARSTGTPSSAPCASWTFDGVATACVFAWEERARESSAFMLDRITKELSG